MATHFDFHSINERKRHLVAQETVLRKQRIFQIAQLAEEHGLHHLSDDEIHLAFQKIVDNYKHR